MKKGKIAPKVISVFVTFIVFGIILLAGPVEAFVLGLTVSDFAVVKGEAFAFQAVADFDINESHDISSFVIDLAGPISTSCSFLPNGTKISSCHGFTITLVTNSSGNYGYGYNTGGTLIYNISLDTTSIPPGVYDSELIAFSNSGVLKKGGPQVQVLQQGIVLERCSVRADDGTMILNGQMFGTNNDLNFNIPKATAVKGQGSFTAQYNGERFNYKFDVTDILSSVNGNSTILVHGDYKIQRNDKEETDAIIFLNKQQGMVNIVSDDFNVTYLDVNFIKGC